LENDLLLVPALVAQLEQAAVDLGLIDRGEQVRFAKALGESLPNAIAHGNLELIQMFLDEVLFGPTGNEITLVKRAHR
jgi:hypothetical protein